jgi:hypothetical protein
MKLQRISRGCVKYVKPLTRSLSERIIFFFMNKDLVKKRKWPRKKEPLKKATQT